MSLTKLGSDPPGRWQSLNTLPSPDGGHNVKYDMTMVPRLLTWLEPGPTGRLTLTTGFDQFYTIVCILTNCYLFCACTSIVPPSRATSGSMPVFNVEVFPPHPPLQDGRPRQGTSSSPRLPRLTFSPLWREHRRGCSSPLAGK